MIMSYRRNKNLKDILVHTALNKTIPTTLSPYFTNIKYISSRRSGAPVWQTFTLLSYNLVYAVQCKLCKAIYVGETGATIKQRLYQHVYHIQKGTNPKLLYVHFVQHHLSNFSLSGLETNASWSLLQRRAAERRWILRLSSTAPLGLNDVARPSVTHRSTLPFYPQIQLISDPYHNFLLPPTPLSPPPPPPPLFFFFFFPQNKPLISPFPNYASLSHRPSQ